MRTLLLRDMNSFKMKPLLAAVALTLVTAGCGVESGKPQSLESPKAAVAANPLAVLLAYQGGTNRTDTEIRQRQEQIRAGKQPDIALERLGWLFVAKARESFDAGYFKLAEHCALALDARQPNSAEALLLRGHVLQNLHRFAESEVVARELVAARGLAFDYGVLGDALMEQGKLDEAIAAYQQMADLKPDSQAATRAAHIRWLKGDLAGAIEMMQLAANAVSAREPENAAWVFTRLAVYQFQAAGENLLNARPHPGPLPRGEGESSSASSEIVSGSSGGSLTSKKETPTVIPSLGGEGQGEGGRSNTLPDFTEAERNCEAALTLCSNYPPALLLSGKMLMAQNRFSEAVEALRVAEKQNPLPEYQWALADALDTAGRNSEAREVEVKLRRFGASADPRSFALFLATRGDKSDTALRLAHEELTTRADVFTHDALAWSQLGSGNIAVAQESMERALSAGTQDARLFFHAATIAARAGQTSVAENYFQKSRALVHLLLPSERKQLYTVAAQLTESRAVATSGVDQEQSSAGGKTF
ncbi:MAG: tetratricopeptide repeat protein [Verrucomicrobia bacterium]|nr:MAG: tetratricopeptide repeat protein [Verrucomicrobiota bacterium]